MLPQPTTVTAAAGYWISKLITTWDIDVPGINPRIIAEHAAWRDRNPKYFLVTRSSIDTAIATRVLLG